MLSLVSPLIQGYLHQTIGPEVKSFEGKVQWSGYDFSLHGLDNFPLPR